MNHGHMMNRIDNQYTCDHTKTVRFNKPMCGKVKIGLRIMNKLIFPETRAAYEPIRVFVSDNQWFMLCVFIN